jgi:hypothetical protein
METVHTKTQHGSGHIQDVSGFTVKQHRSASRFLVPEMREGAEVDDGGLGFRLWMEEWRENPNMS